VDVRAEAGRARRRADHPGAERRRGIVPVGCGPGTEPAPDGAAWTLRTVAAILANPRYTGRQVWNRQRTDFDLADPATPGWGTSRCSGGSCPKTG
jgi:hypothetical protein